MTYEVCEVHTPGDKITSEGEESVGREDWEQNFVIFDGIYMSK